MAERGWLWVVAAKLWLAVGGGGKIMGGRGWLWVVVDGPRWLWVVAWFSNA